MQEIECLFLCKEKQEFSMQSDNFVMAMKSRSTCQIVSLADILFSILIRISLCRLGKGRTLSLKFLRAPKQALGNDNGQIEGLELEENELVEKNGRQVAVSTGQFEQIKVTS